MKPNLLQNIARYKDTYESSSEVKEVPRKSFHDLDRNNLPYNGTTVAETDPFSSLTSNYAGPSFMASHLDELPEYRALRVRKNVNLQ